MTKKHQQELDQLGNEIYESVADKITAYCEKKYGADMENTIEQQLEDYICVADHVSAYLLGNALALLDPKTDSEEIKDFVEHIKMVAAYVRSQKDEPQRMS